MEVQRDGDSGSDSDIPELSGYAEPGTLTALMGCSGAGKSTLLNVLAQRNLTDLQISGRVAINGVSVEELPVVSKLVGYIQQSELIPDTLTVKEHLTMTAQFLLSEKLPFEAKLKRVNEVIAELGLQKCADILIGGGQTGENISGGERKRLSIACRLLDNPRILLLDEPTSGLDAFLARTLILQLTKLTERGYTVLCTIHQPSSDVFRMFDKLILLAEGRCTYHGSRDALQYFSNLDLKCPDNYNPADFYISLLVIRPLKETQSKILIKKLCNAYEHSSEARRVRKRIEAQYKRRRLTLQGDVDIKDQSKREYQVSWLMQFFLLTKRYVLRTKRTPQRIIALIVTTIITLFLWSAFFFNIDGRVDQTQARNAYGLLFFYTIQVPLNAGAPLMETAIQGFAFLKKDYKDSMYTPSAFLMSTTISELVFALPSAFVLYIGTYYFAGLYRDPEVIIYSFLILCLCTIDSTGFYFIIGLIFENTNVASAVSFPIQVIFIILGGYYLNLRTMPVYGEVIHYIDWFPWTNEAISILQWREVKHIDCEYEDPSLCTSTGQEMLTQRGFNEENLAKSIYVLCGQLVFYQVLVFGITLYKVRRSLD